VSRLEPFKSIRTYASPEAEEEDDDAAPAVVAAPETDDAPTLLRHLALHEPLKLALARDFPLVIRKLRKTSAGIAKMDTEAAGEETLHKGLGYLHYQTLLAYATTLAFYIHLCALPADERPDFHPIIGRLRELKQGLAALEDLDFDAGSVSDKGPELFVRPGFGDESEDDEDVAEAKRELMARMFGKLPGGAGEGTGLEAGELAGLLADQDEEEPVALKAKKAKKEKKDKKNKSKQAAAEDEGEQSTPAAAFPPLAEPEFVHSKTKKKAKPALAEADETLGDLLELTDADAGDKEHRKRSLQFHTQKIASMSARRSAARERRAGGDDDIPYRNRQAARDAALRKNAPRDLAGGEDLDGSEWSASDRKRAREVRDEEASEGGDGEGDDEAGEYYDLVKRRKVAKEVAKADAHEAFREAKFEDMRELDEGSEGPRGVSRAIEKNRGLTPRRSKTGRNPRVKKKLAYEKAKQKVGSQRAVYKGGQSALGGAYAGEQSGISTVTKSRKF
jgi:U3 small nucleolar RNA-associated protein 3